MYCFQLYNIFYSSNPLVSFIIIIRHLTCTCDSSFIFVYYNEHTIINFIYLWLHIPKLYIIIICLIITHVHCKKLMVILLFKIITVLLILQDFQKVVKSSVTTLKWPKARSSHATTIVNTISSNKQTISHLMVMGGLDDFAQTLSDCWIMNLSCFIWYQVMYIITVKHNRLF